MDLSQLIYRLATEPTFRESLQPTSEIFTTVTSALTLQERQALNTALQQGNQWYQLLTVSQIPSDDGWPLPIATFSCHASNAA